MSDTTSARYALPRPKGWSRAAPGTLVCHAGGGWHLTVYWRGVRGGWGWVARSNLRGRALFSEQVYRTEHEAVAAVLEETNRPEVSR
jgi:hypothetical protein